MHPPTQTMAKWLERALRAGVRGVLLETTEEDRAIELLQTVADALGWPSHCWSAASGVDHAGSRPLGDLLAELATHHEPSLWVLLDAGPCFESPPLVRALRELAQRRRGPTLVLVERPGPIVERLCRVPELVVQTLPPPSIDELTRHITRIAEVLDDHDYPEASERLMPQIGSLARIALGLPRRDVDRLIAEAILEHGPDPDALAQWIAAGKPQALDRAGMLESVPALPIEELGGLPHLKTWLHQRALALDPHAWSVGIPAPRGVLLLGVQGCGKSLAARMTSTILGLPIVRLDPGRLFAGTVGHSESNLRQTLALVDRLAPIVLWLDEIDKGLAGSEGSASDAGTTARVVGSLLTWLQERNTPVFVTATANRVDALPPELLRRGRLDEIFFVDLPDSDQREAILRVHLETVPLRRLGQIPPYTDPWSAFAEVIREAKGLSGAEIEAAVIEARLHAFASRRPLAVKDLRQALHATVPLSRTRAEAIAALRAWAADRARRA